MKPVFYQLFILVFFNLHCNNQIKLAKEASSEEPAVLPDIMSAEGILKDLSGLDGCQWMIHTEDELRLQPIKWPSKIPELKNGLAIRFVYREIHDVMTICMAGDKVVEIVEVELIPSSEESCLEIIDPYRVSWMTKLVEQEITYSITRYRYEDSYAFYFQTGQKNYLYDCDGNFICEVPARVMNECAETISTLADGTVIWVTNE